MNGDVEYKEPDPEPMHNGEPLLMEYERLETTRRMLVTEDNMLSIARHFGWVVGFDEKNNGEIALFDPDKLKDVGRWGPSPKARAGDMLDERGNRYSADRRWKPRGTYTEGGINMRAVL